MFKWILAYLAAVLFAGALFLLMSYPCAEQPNQIQPEEQNSATVAENALNPAEIEGIDSLDRQNLNPEDRGREATVSGWHHWVVVLNKDGIKNATKHFAKGDQCVLDDKGTLKVLAASSNDYITLYKSPHKDPGGTSAPSGVICALPKEEFLAMSAQGTEKR